MQTTISLRYRQRQPEDRVTIASLLQLNHSLREIDTVLRRSPSTVCREQCRNSIMDAAAVVHSPDLNDALAVTFAHPVAKLSELDLIKRNSKEYGEQKYDLFEKSSNLNANGINLD